jgi:hypothetical protein
MSDACGRALALRSSTPSGEHAATAKSNVADSIDSADLKIFFIVD